MKNNIKSWLPVLSLALAVFIFVTSEFVPVGLLPDISEGVGETPSKTGLLLTGYAWVVAVMSLPLTLATGSLDRRKLLLILMIIFCAGNLTVTLFSSFYPVLLSRFIVALAHSVFWSIATPLAARLAPNGKTAYGLGIIAAGGALGTVLGVPLGTFIGQQFTWKTTFIVISAVSITVFAVLAVILPRLPSINTGSVKSLPKLAKNSPLLLSYGITCFLITGHFTLYTYVVPFLAEEVHISANGIVALLFVFGFSGTTGIFIVGKFLESCPIKLMMTGISAIILILAALSIIKTSIFLICAAFITWSIALTIFGISMQNNILKLAPYAADAAVSIYSGIFNVGIGCGALIGGMVLKNIGLTFINIIACLIALPALFLLILQASMNLSRH
ncbi:MAG: MFS transporter [Deferribacteraceae bacterium]|nr:MFS transporter [Deferribacteraceae bacterium]